VQTSSKYRTISLNL